MPKQRTPSGKHKARVFESSLGISRLHAPDLQSLILCGIHSAKCEEGSADAYGQRYIADFPISFQNQDAMKEKLKLLDAVALTVAIPEHGLVEAQVGTIVEVLKLSVYEVEFLDDNGETYALTAPSSDALIALHYGSVAA